ncbi:M23 family metallopeptidase [bacterium]|nr:M23 family metallopeptidase [bacterium]
MVIKRFRSILIFSIFLLSASCASSPGFGIYHRVKQGETVSGIARLYGTDVETIRKNNELSDINKIAAGDYIFVPGVSAPKNETARSETAGTVQSKPAEPKSSQQPAKKAAPKQTASKKQPAKTNIKAKNKYVWPAKGVVTSPFGPRWSRNHNGIDIGCPEGTPVYAAAAGKAVKVGQQGGFGNLIVLQHSGDEFTIYAHNSKNLIREGAVVKQGEQIALVGDTGNSTGPHLHFEIRINSQPVDPTKILPPLE